ncbi:phospholipase D-like domain-containing protein [Leptospira noguchii]|uniref:phospholipase D-like domain-containing protein n=1 Tax=Leptospira noguchii TaxID=28182 RepID=UPI001FB8518B|nr:phospholipase D-like domain-containing protein [Leptospira noguchii]UOG35689.1 phospholipase D-like domain-containing protein [Leptospira noguchii]UOG46620.1 phospholipase D-like domain-containing protein [Leptospira noguchii]
MIRKGSLYILIFICLAVCSNQNDSDLFWLEWGRLRKVETHFSFPGRYVPTFKKRNVRDKILKLIESAQFSIDLWIYSFDDLEILNALKNANARGVTIQILADPEKEYSIELKSLGLFQKWEKSGLQHSKILIVDRKKVFLGSGNFTWYGLENDLNGYVSFDLFDSEIQNFYSFLDENFISLSIPPFEFYISPAKGRLIQNLILREVDRSQNEIKYLIFDHFDSVLTSRLALADLKGIKVKGIYDSPVDAEGKFLANVFRNPGSEIAGDGNDETISLDSFGKGGLLHHKTMILDNQVLISGSYNFSMSARDKNREILFKTIDPYLIDSYSKEWERIRQNAISYRPIPFQTEEVSNSVFFGHSENSILVEQTICRTDNSKEESFYLESGKSFFTSILEYDFSPTESCKKVSEFSSSSSGFSGRKTNHPVQTRRFRENGILRSKKGNLIFISSERISGDFPPDFEKKPVYLFMPVFYSIQSGNLLFPQSLENFKNPNSIFIYQRGNGPIAIPGNISGNSISVIPNSTEGILFLEYNSLFLAFCFHEYSKKGIEYTELIHEMISFRESAFTSNEYLSAEDVPINQVKNLGTYCYRY